jgi:pyruvate,orthophosphate dikinase
LQIDYAARTASVQGRTYKEGDFLSIDGTVGEVYAGEIKTAASEIVQVLVEKTLKPGESKTYLLYKQLMDWCDKATRMDVRTNADTPEQTANAVAFGATGIGLC